VSVVPFVEGTRSPRQSSTKISAVSPQRARFQMRSASLGSRRSGRFSKKTWRAFTMSSVSGSKLLSTS